MTRESLDEQLSALEAALPFLRQSLAPGELASHLDRYARDILSGADSAAERGYVRERLQSMHVPAGAG